MTWHKQVWERWDAHCNDERRADSRLPLGWFALHFTHLQVWQKPSVHVVKWLQLCFSGRTRVCCCFKTAALWVAFATLPTSWLDVAVSTDFFGDAGETEAIWSCSDGCCGLTLFVGFISLLYPQHFPFMHLFVPHTQRGSTGSPTTTIRGSCKLSSMT